MIRSLVDAIAAAHEPQRHGELLRMVWEQERWFDTPRQLRAAELARDAMAAAGLAEARLVPFPADGRTRYQDWTTHLAWECRSAQVRLGRTILADRATCPAAVVYWGGPLAETTAPVIDGDAVAHQEAEKVRGKYLLTSDAPRAMKERLGRAGPAAILSDYIGKTRGADADTTKWCNTWADGPDGWYFRARDTVLPGFCLSPRAGKELRSAIAADPLLRITARCDGRLYEGQGQCVTGLIPGTDPSREVWLFAHGCEQGAHDNASGVSVLLEAGHILEGLFRTSALPRPRGGIRLIITEECIGMLAFATEQAELRRRALVGMNVDAVGDVCDADRPFKVHFGPLSNPTLGWAVAGLIGQVVQDRAGGEYRLDARCEPPTADDMIADPGCGVPTLWLGMDSVSTGYHSSLDRPEICSDASLRWNAILAAAWAYIMADLDARRFDAILPGAAEWIERHLLASQQGDALRLRHWAAGRMLRDAGRWGVPASAYEPAAARYCRADAPPLDDLPADGPVFRRTTWGTCTLENWPQTPRPGRPGFSRWSHWQAAALYWTDGRRPLAAVKRLTAAEVAGTPDEGLGPLMDACMEAGLAECGSGPKPPAPSPGGR